MKTTLSEEFLNAVESNDIKSAERLLEAGANPNVRSRRGEYALFIAVSNFNCDMADLLIRKGASLMARTIHDETPVAAAIRTGDKRMVEIVLGTSSERLPFEGKGIAVLRLAVKYGMLEIFDLLVKRGADINVKDSSQETLISKAVQDGDVMFAERLLSLGANVNTRLGWMGSNERNTILMEAIDNENLKMAEVILKYKPDLSIKNHDGEDALEMASQKDNNEALMELLERNGAIRNSDGERKKTRKNSFTPLKISNCKLSDVMGLERAKAELMRDVIYPLKHPELAREFGVELGGGVLLYGPPGCGKTLMAKAIAGETGMNLIEVQVPDILNPFVGQDAKSVAAVFKKARKSAPCIVFFDEIDTLGASRDAPDSGSWMREILTTFLTEMDGIQGSNSNIIVIGATNLPWKVDSALKRHGRLGKVVLVPPPSSQIRASLFKQYLSGRPTAANVDLNALADMTKMCTGADIKAICREAAKVAWERALMQGITSNNSDVPVIKQEITQEDIAICVNKERYNLGEWYAQAKGMLSGEENRHFYSDLVDQIALYDAENGIQSQVIYR